MAEDVLYRFSERAKRYVPVKAEIKADGPDQSQLFFEAIRMAVGFIEQVLAAEAIPREIQSTLQRAIDALEGVSGQAEGEAEVLPEQHKTAAERVQEMEEGYKSMVQKQVDQAMDVYLKQMEVQTKSLLSSQPLGPSSLPSPEKLTDDATRKAMARIDMDVRAAHEDEVAADLRAKMRAEIERAKRG